MKAISIYNKGYEAELTIGKVYDVIQDDFADDHNLIRIKDDSDDVCYYSKRVFKIKIKEGE
jgi:hypothetical protein